VDKIIRAPLFCSDLEKQPDIFRGFKVFSYVKWFRFKCHALFSQLFQKFFSFDDISLLGGLIATGKKKNYFTILNRIINALAGTKEHTKFKEIGAYCLMVSKRTFGHTVDAIKDSGKGQFVFYSIQPFIVLFCASQFVSHIYIVSIWIQKIKGITVELTGPAQSRVIKLTRQATTNRRGAGGGCACACWR